MPITKKWSHYTKQNVKREDDYYGVYEIGHIKTGKVLYIGEGRVRSRLLAHFPDGHRPHEIVVGGDGYRVQYLGAKTKALQKEQALFSAFKCGNAGKLPKYNQRH